MAHTDLLGWAVAALAKARTPEDVSRVGKKLAEKKRTMGRNALADDEWEFLRKLYAGRLTATRAAGKCCRHGDTTNHVDVVTDEGRIRTTCRVCGRFFGYKPGTDT